MLLEQIHDAGWPIGTAQSLLRTTRGGVLSMQETPVAASITSLVSPMLSATNSSAFTSCFSAMMTMDGSPHSSSGSAYCIARQLCVTALSTTSLQTATERYWQVMSHSGGIDG